MNLTGTLVCAAALLAGPAIAADAPPLPPPAKKQGVTFAKDIQPIFEKSCVKCHSGERPKGKLRLDTLDATMAGTRAGKPDGIVVVPGDSAKSQIVRTIGHQVERDLWMPPPDNRQGIKPLTAGEIGLIRAWIDQGAK